MVLTTPALNLKKERTSFTQEELSKLWVLHGQVYDFTDFVKYHPAGSRAILLGRGRDCTVLFESYHTILPSDALLEKYRVSAPNVRTTPRAFPSLPHSSLHARLLFGSQGRDVGLRSHHASVLQLLLV
jgi:cytochrome b involved in lipid metabolism